MFQRRIADSHTCVHEVGTVAERAGARQLVLSHLPPHSDEQVVLTTVAQDYRGPVLVGYDLLVV